MSVSNKFSNDWLDGNGNIVSSSNIVFNKYGITVTFQLSGFDIVNSSSNLSFELPSISEYYQPCCDMYFPVLYMNGNGDILNAYLQYDNVNKKLVLKPLVNEFENNSKILTTTVTWQV